MGITYNNGKADVGSSGMYYVSFGDGEKKVILIPGLSDGFATVKGKARMLVGPYKPFLGAHTVYMFSRRNDIPEGFSIEDMAEDQAAAMKELGIESAYIVGVSQGGMIAQFLAAKHPELVKKLVLAVTAPCVNDIINDTVNGWIKMAEADDHKQLMIDTAEKSYSPGYLKKYRKFYPFLGMLAKPDDNYRRFFINAKAILGFDARGILNDIQCPTLIVGGSDDKTTGTQALYDLHERIAGSELYVYDGLGHATYEEAPDFNERIFAFIDR